MNVILRDGLVFSVAVLVIFLLIDTITNIAFMVPHHWKFGFPLTFFEYWGLCPGGSGNSCVVENYGNFAINAAVGIIIGFVGSFVRNRKRRK